MRISLRTVLLVAKKELLEAIRDRRTLFVALVLPVLLYPMMMLAVGPLIGKQRQRIADRVQQVAVTGDDAGEIVRAVFRWDEDEKPVLSVVPVDDPAAALTRGEIALWIEATDGAAEALVGDGSAEVIVHHDSSDDESRAAHRKWQSRAQRAADRILLERLDDLELPQSWLKPIEVRELVDVASSEARSGYVLGKMLALILLLMTLTSSFYPAVDVVAGEKERGTMETLLVAPCRRDELVLGKYLAVGAVTLVAALLNLLSMWLTLGPLVNSMGVEGMEGLSLGPLSVLGILALLVPLAALFSALSIALSTMARSVKEAQHYLTPMFLLVMPLAMVVVIPGIELTPTLAALPITNVVLFFRDLMVGKFDGGIAAITLISTVATAALALYGTVQLFLREETLFRGPEGSAPLLQRPKARRFPTPFGALFLCTISLALIWYLQPVLPSGNLLQNVFATQALVIAAPCALFAWWFHVSFRDTFRLRRPHALALLMAVPLGLAAPIVNGFIQHHVVGEIAPEGPFHKLAEAFEALVQSTPAFVLVLLIGVLPAVCEELFYRGYVLSGLSATKKRRGRPGVVAIVATAALFAVFHIYPEKWLGTFLVGLLLGLLAVAGRSIWPAIVAHALNNASLVMTAKMGEDSLLARLHDHQSGNNVVAVSISTVIVGLGIAALIGLTRARPEPDPDSDSEPAARPDGATTGEVDPREGPG